MMIKVGIVEDNKTLREGFETLINRTPGMQCICTCSTVGEGVKQIPAAKPDVVLMDIQLPDGTGIECTAKIKEQLPTVQIIVVTVYADSDWIFQALQAGACGYLLKRATPARIIEAIQEAQEGGVPMTPEIARKVIGQFQAPIKAAEEVDSLTPRETEVLQLVMHGMANKEIADRMSISVNSVKWHLRHIYEKLHVRSRVEAVLKYKNQQNPE
jgi:DNA-binding NarL/FixJ family response regulator